MGKVSLITPVFNVSENLLDRCAKSVLGQYDVDWEWLLIDDGSESDCAEYLDALAKHDCRIRVFHQKNRGPAQARNQGLLHASGTYVVFLDSDDALTEGCLSQGIRMMETHPQVDIVIGQAQYLRNGVRRMSHSVCELQEPLTLPESEKGGLLREMWIGCGLKKYPNVTGRLSAELWGKMYRRDKMQDVAFSRELYNGEDQIFLFDFLRYAREAVIVPEIWYLYTYRDDSVQHMVSAHRVEKYGAYLREIRRCCESMGNSHDASRLCDVKIATSVMDCLKPYMAEQNFFKACKQTYKVLRAPALREQCKQLCVFSGWSVKQMSKILICRYALTLMATAALYPKEKKRENGG